MEHADITDPIIGCLFELFNTLGGGLFESNYQNALPIALRKRGIESEQEVRYQVRYDGHVVGEYRADLVVASKVIVEIKVAEKISKAHVAQVLNYLRISGLRVGLILNFGDEPTFKRVVR